jgi:hypothetical protein
MQPAAPRNTRIGRDFWVCVSDDTDDAADDPPPPAQAPPTRHVHPPPPAQAPPTRHVSEITFGVSDQVWPLVMVVQPHK